ncbi:hypothetical protein [Rhodocaloribacter litoris]|uniref:hypothetical protein n=1 Tax=Rhodocaloribacter litoris TaxID=2558931 RepID=UPI001E618797|nr:hypothetical protein [Rhodocaloribacter litoris]
MKIIIIYGRNPNNPGTICGDTISSAHISILRTTQGAKELYASSSRPASRSLQSPSIDLFISPPDDHRPIRRYTKNIFERIKTTS